MSSDPSSASRTPYNPGAPSRGRIAAFWAILAATPLILIVLAVQCYYLYAYLTFPAYYCGSFAALDGEIGWTLEPGSESCIGGIDPETGDVAFEAPVFVNADGARSGPMRDETPESGVLIIGDSWSFGYGISYEETFAAQLTETHGYRTALFASPAYSGGQALLLGRRVLAEIQPDTIVYFENGFLWRTVCTGTDRPTDILKPCYWTAPDGTAELIIPEEGTVESAAAWGYYPGGMLGAGENSLPYFLISRPLAKLSETLVRLGIKSGFGDDFAPYAEEEELDAIRRAHVQELAILAREADAMLLLIDPGSIYADLTLSPEIVYVDAATWQAEVTAIAETLPARERIVPADNHYGPGVHRLIADLIAAQLAEIEN